MGRGEEAWGVLGSLGVRVGDSGLGFDFGV